MNSRFAFNLCALAALATACQAQAQAPNHFPGLYAGVEAGAVSFNTHITFDGVDDPAGRGATLYGVFVGYNHIRAKWLMGAEASVNLAATPDPYTFDPGVAGFSEMDLRRGASAGLDVRLGYLVARRILLYGTLGYSANNQSVRIDGVSLDQFAGGADTEAFRAFQFGAGLEVAIHRKLRLRVSGRTLSGHDLSAPDFGTIPNNAGLTHLDVEPSQQHFLAGLVFRW